MIPNDWMVTMNDNGFPIPEITEIYGLDCRRWRAAEVGTQEATSRDAVRLVSAWLCSEV